MSPANKRSIPRCPHCVSGNQFKPMKALDDEEEFVRAVVTLSSPETQRSPVLVGSAWTHNLHSSRGGDCEQGSINFCGY
jgi:hypothetical protein